MILCQTSAVIDLQSIFFFTKHPFEKNQKVGNTEECAKLESTPTALSSKQASVVTQLDVERTLHYPGMAYGRNCHWSNDVTLSQRSHIVMNM